MVATTPSCEKVCIGGHVLIDDYGDIAACKAAVEDFRAAPRITNPIQTVVWTGVFCQRTS